VLVSGASGLIGSRALAPLRERGFDVHAVARRPPAGDSEGVSWHRADLLDASERRAVVAAVGASHLLHLAWYAEPGAFWTATENAAWTSATIALAEEFAAAGGQRAVVAGTCAEYDWSAGAAVAAGGALREDAPAAPSTLYGVCKDATRRVVASLSEPLGVATAWGRIFFLYGPGEDERRLVAGVARGLVAGERVATSEGTQVRDFLHVDDVAGAFAALVDSDVTGAVNVASGEGVTVRHVVETLARLTGRPELLDAGALPMRPGDPASLVADVARLRGEVGWTPRIGLEDGLRETVAWWGARAAR
jgi:nucleoside-diphosphate-sugar epimerase